MPPNSSDMADAKRARIDRNRADKRARRARRREIRRCFWTWPFGHRYETPDGRSSSEVFSAMTPGGGGARPNLRCVGCGRGFGIGER